jgi:UDP-GlcNAc:undecaprenyl-phosphate GlcNAc-1-phosphate transferase
MMTKNYSGLIIVAFCITTWIGVQHLGYVEFGVAGRLFVDGAFRRLLNSHISIENLEEDLAAANTPEDCWKVLQKGYQEFGFSRIDVHLAGRTFTDCLETEPLDNWKVTVPISNESQIELYRGFGPAQQHQVVAAFVDVLRKTLEPKAAMFERVPSGAGDRLLSPV